MEKITQIVPESALDTSKAVLEEAEGQTAQNESQSVTSELSALESLLEEEIRERDCTDEERAEMLEKLHQFRDTKTNIILVGATGSGKSSTINALFSCGPQQTGDLEEVAKVGITPDPETSKIEKYTIGNLTLWDTPGLGDSANQDERSSEAIQDLLEQTDDNGNSLIDLVLVVMDASSKDLGTTYSVLNDVIIPTVEDTDHILIAINQADLAMKHGRHWNYEDNCPDEVLQAYLEEKVRSVRDRIREDSGMEVSPIYYCAGCKDDDEVVIYPYNMAKLLYYIVSALPIEKRVPVLEGLNDSKETFEYNDNDLDYGAKVEESFFETLGDMISDAAEAGAELGGYLLGIPGKIIGGVIGGAVGTVGGCLVGVFNFLDGIL